MIMNNLADEKNSQAVPARKRRGCLWYLGIGAVVFLGLLVVALAAGAIYQSAASASDLKKYSPPGQLYPVGDHKLHLYCTGEGSPTVILEAGSGSPALTWYLVQKEVSGFTRVCSYDRPGFGWSDPATGPLSREQAATTLHQLLETASVTGPYILAGHSAGGEYIRSYAAQYPSEVLGLVFVDSSHESQTLRYPPQFLAFSKNQLLTMKLCQVLSPFGVVRVTKLWDTLIPESWSSLGVRDAVMSTLYRTGYCKAAYAEESTLLGSPGQAEGPISLGDLPLVVLSAGATFEGIPKAVVTAMGGPEVIAQVNQVQKELQKELVSLSTQGKQIIAAESGHNIQLDQPDLVIDAIHTVFEQARSE
jgi:pimeloyl-ACP methyl ester carboxylesterase